jgi:hypothetical protein
VAGKTPRIHLLPFGEVGDRFIAEMPNSERQMPFFLKGDISAQLVTLQVNEHAYEEPNDNRVNPIHVENAHLRDEGSDIDKKKKNCAQYRN